ncbi:hypothetical protein [uncultured Paenalcaligenes sp.]|uniref:hypothetical protein n=1 Tax=uncultured Paenalcaligenes sp. TaxID=1588925 RepID=UPI002612354D|nr:hypothetical protein [uncultured Paenalcaligenes sp.]
MLKSSSHSHPARSPFDEQRQRAIQKAKYSASDQDTLAQIDYAIERKIRLAIIQSARQSIFDILPALKGKDSYGAQARH